MAVAYVALKNRWDFYTYIYNEEMLKLLSYDGYGIILTLPEYIYIAIDMAWALVIIGMIFFSKASRYIFILLILFGTIMSLFWGVRVTSPASTFSLEILNLLTGGILVYSYFGAVGQRFKGDEKTI
ncbi:MAG: hypothetical protein KAT25_02305 [Sulfuriflexus sp.]|nr:hypothetical protein [Sulfuriflexus sp.]